VATNLFKVRERETGGTSLSLANISGFVSYVFQAFVAFPFQEVNLGIRHSSIELQSLFIQIEVALTAWSYTRSMIIDDSLICACK
jgi:hypothetical protein